MLNKLQFQQFEFWKLLVLGLVAVDLFYLFYSGLSIHQLFDSPFHYKGLDPTFWLLEGSGLVNLICSNSQSAYLFEGMLFLCLCLSIFFIKQRIWVILFGLFLLVYQIVFNYKLGYHTHHLYGLQFALFPFYFKADNRAIAFNFSRFMLCLTYFMAGLFKLIGAAYMHADNLSNTLQSQHAAYWYFYPNGSRISWLQFLMAHPYISNGLFVMAVVMQLAFVIGFFTKRWDRLLMVCLCLFHLMDWALMNLGIFMGMCIMAYLFVMPRGLMDFEGTKK